MARLAAVAENLYYPTPLKIIRLIASLLVARTTGSYGSSREAIYLDPCAGEGMALHLLSELMNEKLPVGARHFTYGNELNYKRYQRLSRMVDRSMRADFFLTDISEGEVDFMLFNPPYDDDREYGRMETKFLMHATPLMRNDGVIAIIVSRRQVEPVARYIASHYRDVSAFTFTEDTYDRFKQVVIMGVKKPETLPDEEIEQYLLSFAAKSCIVPPPTGRWYQVLYSAYRQAESKFIFAKRLVDVPGALRAYPSAAAAAYREHREMIRGLDNTSLTSRPPLEPMADNYLRLLMAAGGINGIPTDIDGVETLMNGSSYKVAYTRKQLRDDGSVKHVETERIKTVFKTLRMDTWDFANLDGDDLTAFLAEHGATIQERFKNAHPPLIRGDVLDDVEFPSVLRQPLNAQRSAIMNGYYGLKENRTLFLSADTGTGKTYMALAMFAKLYEEGLASRMLTQCPPHLVGKWVREVLQTVPNARTAILENVADVDREIGRERILDWVDKRLNDPTLRHVEEGIKMALSAALYEQYWQTVADRAVDEDSSFEIRKFARHLNRNLGRPMSDDEVDVVVAEVLAGRVDREVAWTFSASDVELGGLDSDLVAEVISNTRAAESRLAAARALARDLWAVSTEQVVTETHMPAAVIERELPGLNVTGSRNSAAEAVDRGPMVMVVGRERSKLGAARRPSYRVSYVLPPHADREKVEANPTIFKLDDDVNRIEWLRGKAEARVPKENRVEILSCVECFAPLWQEGEDGKNNKVPVYLRPGDFKRKQIDCLECGAPAWTQGPLTEKRPIRSFAEWDAAVVDGTLATKTHQAAYKVQKGLLKDGNRFPVAERIKQHSRRRKDFHLFAGDEIHEYKDGTSAQGIAAAILSASSERTLVMTGTLYDGKSSNLFFLLRNFEGALRAEYGHKEVNRFIRNFGFFQRSYITEGGESSSTGLVSRRRSRQSTKEVADLHPDLLKLMLPSMVSVRLEDVADFLPPNDEYVVDVAMEESQAERYDYIQGTLKGVLEEQMRKGSKRLLGAWLQVLLSCSDRCYEREVLYDTVSGDKVLDAPGINADVIYPKEAALLKVVRNELGRSRRVMVYVAHSDRRDLRPRIVKILRDAGYKAEMLSASISAGKREERISQMLDDGMEVFVTNPKLVQTGLDLLDFPTIVFYETDYSAYVTRQGSGRAFRIGQAHPVSVFYIQYAATMQQAALHLISSKAKASLALEGKLPDGGLATASEMADEDGFYIALARMLATGQAFAGGEDSLSIEAAIERANAVQDEYYLENPHLQPTLIPVQDAYGESTGAALMPAPILSTILSAADREVLAELIANAPVPKPRHRRRYGQDVVILETDEPVAVQADLFTFALSAAD